VVRPATSSVRRVVWRSWKRKKVASDGIKAKARMRKARLAG
jgi:hypothetical protein